MTPSSGADVRVPPPVVYLGGFLATWLLNQRLEFLIDGKGARAPQAGLGLVALAAGVSLAVWAVATLRRARVPILPWQPVPALVTSGPYRFTRNPIYVGLTFAYVGAALVVNWAWALVLLPVVLIVMNVAVVEPEERYLGAAFPDVYASFSANVRRWL